MITFTRYQAAAGIAVLTIGSFVTAVGLVPTTVSPNLLDSGHVLAQQDKVLTETVLTQTDKVLTDTEVIGGPRKRPIVEQPPIKPRVPPVKERLQHANEGVGNGVDGNTPGHAHNGGNDDPQFSPGNPGAKN